MDCRWWMSRLVEYWDTHTHTQRRHSLVHDGVHGLQVVAVHAGGVLGHTHTHTHTQTLTCTWWDPWTAGGGCPGWLNAGRGFWPRRSLQMAAPPAYSRTAPVGHINNRSHDSYFVLVTYIYTQSNVLGYTQSIIQKGDNHIRQWHREWRNWGAFSDNYSLPKSASLEPPPTPSNSLCAN